MKRLTVTVSLLGLIFSGGCAKKLLVGVVLPETGDASAYGTSVKSGAKLAFDDARSAKDVPASLEIVYQDTASDPARGAALADALYKQGALIILGGATSPEAAAMTPIAEKYGRVLLSPSASAANLTRKGGYLFRVYPSDAVEGVRAATFLAVDRKLKSVLVLEEDIPYTQGLLPIFTAEYGRLGGKVIASLKIGDTGWEKQLADRLKADKPEALYLCGYGEAILAAMVEVRNDAYAGLVCTTSAISTVDLVWRGGNLVEGIYFPVTNVNMASPADPVATFVKRYREVYNLTADIYAAHGYDAALVVLFLLNDPTFKPEADLRPRLLGLGATKGVTGTLAFDEKGDVKRAIGMHWIHDGKVEDTETPAR